MPKSAIYTPISMRSQRPENFKRLLLLFDKVLIAQSRQNSPIDSLLNLHGLPKEEYKLVHQNLDYLQEEGLLEIVNVTLPFQDPGSEDSIVQAIHEDLKLLDAIQMMDNVYGKAEAYYFNNKEAVIASRLLSAELAKKEMSAIPVYNADPAYELGKQQKVMQFVLEQIPAPDENVPWEQLLDFKNDPDTQRKYSALTKWVNEIARKDFALYEIEDEYKYLYQEYVGQFKLHKMRSKQTALEIIVSAALDALSGLLAAGSVKTALFSLWSRNLNLLDAESKFVGREIAYIVKAENEFG